MNLEQYFANLLSDHQVPSGYHQLEIKRVKDILTINYTCDTNLFGINKVIPIIIIEFTMINEDILKILRQVYLDYDFLFLSFDHTETQVTFEYRIIRSYLSLNIIPADIIAEIIKYIDPIDYYNLVDVIKLKLYPDLIQRLSREYFYGVISTITDKGYPATLVYKLYGDQKLYTVRMDEIILYEGQPVIHYIDKTQVEKYGLPPIIREILSKVDKMNIRYTKLGYY